MVIGHVVGLISVAGALLLAVALIVIFPWIKAPFICLFPCLWNHCSEKSFSEKGLEDHAMGEFFQRLELIITINGGLGVICFQERNILKDYSSLHIITHEPSQTLPQSWPCTSEQTTGQMTAARTTHRARQGGGFLFRAVMLWEELNNLAGSNKWQHHQPLPGWFWKWILSQTDSQWTGLGHQNIGYQHRRWESSEPGLVFADTTLSNH